VSGKRKPSQWVETDAEILADVAVGHLEREAERLVAALLAAEKAVQDPDLTLALDANAAAYGDARDTWIADLRCGDLPMAEAEKSECDLGKNARNEMYKIILAAGKPPEWGGGRRQEYDALYDAAAAIHTLLSGLDGDTHDHIAECVADELGEAGPRYVLGA